VRLVSSLLDRALQRPWTTALILLAGLVVSVASQVLGDQAFQRGWALSAWIAWPAGTVVFFVPGFITWLLILVPSGRVEGPWTRRSAAVLVTGTALGALVQLLDDHVFNHAGTDNPLGISIPWPFQDLLTLAALLLVGAALLGTLITLPIRVARGRRSRT
jgi:hypothetical protein